MNENQDTEGSINTLLRENPHKFIQQILRHDLKNHLHVIQLTTEIIKEDADVTGISDHLETIEEQTAAALALLQETKLLANGVRGNSIEALDIAATIESELGQIETAHPDAMVNIDASGDVSVPAPPFLGSIFGNLVRNSIEHNDKPTPKVDVTVTADSESIELTVKDNGPGIPQDILTAIQNHTITPEGGHGLYIVSELIQEYNGSLSADVDSSGTKIEVRLPISTIGFENDQ